ncbi:AraC family transcriptional regulator [Paenibacillus sp. FSL M8-0228]|uniref:AraC family transcriptional regulator n=1 Tax=Paenibacillus polymyxa TaxID=1406 RepID=A0A8I1LT40_PAEPO|nr:MULTISPECIES: AraC family transcriptional regulator [Paenibacillus]KAF6568849.1 AraC family transcriptional regulator [Paenibacillus sp. EKM206P]KAF6585353.1 AraC family transcriptional regulator [Paenibacillus sp. EKM205P]MBM0635980.1 AraC family transcriptional regulator [Paenibacillus polymyxa]MBO3284679.1 AraC family transcriptional regulator [Paenibacillus polymyxa]
MIKIDCYLPSPILNKGMLFPESLGRYKNFPNHGERRNAGLLKEYNLHIIFAGKGAIVHDGKEIELTPGMGFLFGKHTTQQYRTKPEDPWDVRWIHFDGQDVDSLLQGRSMHGPYLFSLHRPERLKPLMEEMLQLAQAYRHDYDVRISSLLYEILLEIVHHSNQIFGTFPGGTVHERIRHTAEYIRMHCQNLLDLKTMAATSGYSSFHFSRLFHQIMGSTPAQYLLQCRITLAKHLLVSTALTVKQIALETGFHQSSYFIKRFREQTGITPEQFRQLRRMG